MSNADGRRTATYDRSSWHPAVLKDLHSRGVRLVGLDEFAAEIRYVLVGGREGLTLYFNTKLTRLQRELVDVVILQVLGRADDCRVVEFREVSDSITIVRLQADRHEDLVSVAEAVYRKFWEEQRNTQEKALVRIANQLPARARSLLTDLRRHIERIEMRSDDENEQPAWIWCLTQDQVTCARPVRLFLSYARKDERYREQFEAHLASLHRQGVIESWHAGLVAPGADHENEIRQQIELADVVVLLLSSDYMCSDSCMNLELRQALDRHRGSRTHIIPVLVRPVDLSGSPLERLACLPEGGRPIMAWRNRENAWVNVISGIRRAVLNFVQDAR